MPYFERWSSRFGPRNPLTELAARARHDARELHVDVFSKDGSDYVVEVVADFVTVYFLDGEERIWLEYSFKELELGQLFLR